MSEFEAVTLSDPSSSLTATVVPMAGMIVTSLRDGPLTVDLPHLTSRLARPAIRADLAEIGLTSPLRLASCLLLDKYLLIGGDRALLGSGAKVTVTGHTEPDMMSFCQQGIYLVVDSVTKTG